MESVLRFNIVMSRILSFNCKISNQYLPKYLLHTSTSESSQYTSKNVSKTHVTHDAAHPSLQPLKIRKSNKEFESKALTDFMEFDLRKDVLDALTKIEVIRPSQIQALAIPRIIEGRNVCIAAETGSGKTLAYLAPIIHLLKQEQTILNVETRVSRPRALILVPTAELCIQVLAVAKSLAHTTKFRARAIYKGLPGVKLKSALESPNEILISTPMTLFLQKKYNNISLEDLAYLVFDEHDTLFDSSFLGINEIILKSLNLRTSPLSEEGIQVVVAGASLSTYVKKRIVSQIPEVEFIQSEGLHKVLPHVEQRFYRCLPGDKEKTILKVISNNSNLKTLIFCNTIDSVEWLGHHLSQNNISTLQIHGGLPDIERSRIIKEFQTEENRILVGTDILSRGIDTATVKHVIMFDFPSQPIDYLHRVGRTGRLNPLHVEGKIQYYKVSALVVKKRDVKLTEDMKRASRKGKPLDLYSKGWK